MRTAHELLKAVGAGLAILLLQTAAAQTTGTYDQFAHQRIEVERYVVLPSTFEYYIQRYPSLMGDHAWTGKQEDALYDRNTFRTVYAWSLTGTSGIPTNATITNVRLYLQGTLTSNAPPNNPPTIDFQVRNFPPSSLSASPDQKWTAINNAQTLDTWSPPRSVGTFNTYIDYPQGSDFANAVESRLGGTLALGMKAVDESWVSGASSIHVVDFKRAPSVDPSSAVRIVVNYTVPANNPVPTITSISPDNAMAGGPPFTLTINGTNFISSSVVRWNGGNRTTTFVSATRLEAAIQASDIANPGTASVTVFNPAPGGGTSNPATFTITAASVNVSVHQFLADGSTEVGTLGRWNGSTFGTRLPAPQSYTFQVPSTETLHGDTLIYSNQKHRIWIKGTTNEPNVINHHHFSVNFGFPSSLTSQFAETKNDVTVKTDLLDASGTTGGNIQFKDPWYIDYNDPSYGNAPRNRGQNDAVLYTRSVGATGFKPDYATPFDGGRTYKGVFLNQSGPPFWNPPYYSVGAPSPQTIGGYTSYFLGWDNSNPGQVEFRYPNLQETPVVFKQSNATASAKYKLHLRSSSASATAASTQRKVVRDNFGRYHAVYQSANAIFYTHSNDAGATWLPERMLSAALSQYPHRTPSIVYKPGTGGAQAEGAGEAEESEPHRIRVVWEAYTPDEYSHEVILCELDLNGNITYGPDASYGWNGQGGANPVIGIAPNSVHPSYEPTAYYTLVAWYDGDWNAVRGFVWKPDNSVSESAALAYNASQFSVAPYSHVENVWPLVYVEDNNVMYVPVAEGYTPSAGSPELVHKGDESVIISSPNVSRVSNRVGVVWQAYYWEFVTGAVQYAERVGGNSWTIPSGWLPYYSTSYYQKPTVTGSASQNNARLVFQEESPILATVVGRPGAWSGVQSAGAGADPAMSTGYTGAASEMLISRGTQSPFAIQRQSLSMSAGMMESMTAVAEGRGGRLLYRNGSLHVAVLRAAINNTDVLFAALSDTARIGVGQFESALATEPFAGSGTLTLQMMFSGKGRVPNGAQMRMMVVDAETYQMVQQLRSYSPGNDSLHSLQIPLGHGNRRVRLVLRPVGAGQPQGVSLERWYLPDAPHMVSRQGNLSTAELQQIPESFALHANYPNPFNPSTTIKYDLPEQAHVTLTIYDVLGREVAVLVNQVEGAGFKSVSFDASRLSSGVYLARFAATDGSGSMKLAKVMKLVLAK